MSEAGQTLGEAIDSLAAQVNDLRASLPPWAQRFMSEADPHRMRAELIEHGLRQIETEEDV